MMVVSDIDDIFLPKPTDLLVNLTECRAGLESLLGRINDMFKDNHTVGSALGPALNAAFKLMVLNCDFRCCISKIFLPVVNRWQNYGLVRLSAKCWPGRAQEP